MSPLQKLPLELLELNVCQFLDVTATLQLSLVNRSFQQNITQCSKLWKTLMVYHFGYTSNSPLKNQQISVDNRKNKISWRAVFVVAWQDSAALAQTTLLESDVLQLYCNHVSLLKTPDEAHIRQEILLMEGLRRIPTSTKLIQLYAKIIRQAQLVTRVGGAGIMHGLSQQCTNIQCGM